MDGAINELRIDTNMQIDVPRFNQSYYGLLQKCGNPSQRPGESLHEKAVSGIKR